MTDPHQRGKPESQEDILVVFEDARVFPDDEDVAPEFLGHTFGNLIRSAN